MKQFTSTKLNKDLKEELLGDSNYTYDKDSSVGYYYVQFDLYKIECDSFYFDKIIKAIDYWNSINATERHNHIKQYENVNQTRLTFKQMTLIKSDRAQDFCTDLLKLYHFIHKN